MNGKFEEKLVRHAFGEVTPKEASALEEQAKVDPEATKLLSDFRQVRDDLRLLCDVPPDQLSKERLRDAILGQGLKPEPLREAPRWGWTWMPITAFAIVFGWLTFRQHPTEISRGLTGERGAVAIHMAPKSSDNAINFGLDSKTAAVPSGFGTHHGAAPILTRDGNVHVSLNPHHHLSNRPKNLEAPLPSSGVLTVYAQPRAKQKLGTSSRVDLADRVSNTVDKNSIVSPMVMINPENDSDSHAQKATEVDSASHVVVGG